MHFSLLGAIFQKEARNYCAVTEQELPFVKQGPLVPVLFSGLCFEVAVTPTYTQKRFLGSFSSLHLLYQPQPQTSPYFVFLYSMFLCSAQSWPRGLCPTRPGSGNNWISMKTSFSLTWEEKNGGERIGAGGSLD